MFGDPEGRNLLCVLATHITKKSSQIGTELNQDQKEGNGKYPHGFALSEQVCDLHPKFFILRFRGGDEKDRWNVPYRLLTKVRLYPVSS